MDSDRLIELISTPVENGAKPDAKNECGESRSRLDARRAAQLVYRLASLSVEQPRTTRTRILDAMCIHQLIEFQVERTPDTIAVQFEDDYCRAI
jgi:hypothetical protein